MASTKINFYLGIILVLLLMFLGVGVVGDAFINTDRIVLNEDSIDYIAEVKGVNDDSGYSEIGNTDSGVTQKKGILDSEDNKTVDEQGDFLSTLFIKKERASEPTNYFKLIYNLPNTILISMRLPLSDFKIYTNILGHVFFIFLLIMVWRELRV